MRFCCFFGGNSNSESRNVKQSLELDNQTKPSNNSLHNRVTDSANSSSPPRSLHEMYKEREHNLRVFSLSELRNATEDFNKVLKIGRGGFGSVYKGTISATNGKSDSMVVAIKRLHRFGMQGHKQWLTEVQFLGILNHPNLVKLLGYCCVDTERGIQRLLVYEYMPNKSLEDNLFSTTLPTLPWKTRLEIILGAAEGMAYLHEGLDIQVIYRDFKASNVLLDEDFKPKLSDFGLAREGPVGNQSHVSTQPVGTYGYAAPDYVETGHLSVKSDVYSFGVVLYEILTGRRAVERSRAMVEQKLLDWVRMFPADSKRFSMIIDPQLRTNCSIVAARRIANLADSCVNRNAKDRPAMSEVVDCLKLAIQESEEHTKTPEKSKGKSCSSGSFDSLYKNHN